MDVEVENWLHREWEAFKESHNRCPNKNEEWRKFCVRSEAASPSITLDDIDEAFRDFQIQETMDDDIEIKARDADANLNNRKYVDGSF